MNVEQRIVHLRTRIAVARGQLDTLTKMKSPDPARQLALEQEISKYERDIAELNDQRSTDVVERGTDDD